ncbi:MAG: SGNH/GDSL hydrolase family protein [Bacillota bacterium]|nr:SGNH/GDSL hydrolase family protein [Bacillota bacterium]
MITNKHIAVYGDSILKGVMLDPGSDHYYLAKQNNIKCIESLIPVTVQNNSKFGCTIEKGYRLLINALDSGLNCDVALLEFGGNDSDFNWAEVSNCPEDEHLPHTPLQVFEDTYYKMIKSVRDRGIIPLLMSLPPVDAEKYFTWLSKGLNKDAILKWLGDVQMIYRFQELYSSTVTRIARETGCLFVDVRSRFLDHCNFKNLLCDDGLHPNEAGHSLIRGAFVDFAASYAG